VHVLLETVLLVCHGGCSGVKNRDEKQGSGIREQGSEKPQKGLLRKLRIVRNGQLEGEKKART
jgi:hypothetical protein